MNKPKPQNKPVPQNQVVLPVHAFSDDSFVRKMSAMLGLDPKASGVEKK